MVGFMFSGALGKGWAFSNIARINSRKASEVTRFGQDFCVMDKNWPLSGRGVASWVGGLVQGREGSLRMTSTGEDTGGMPSAGIQSSSLLLPVTQLLSMAFGVRYTAIMSPSNSATYSPS